MPKCGLSLIRILPHVGRIVSVFSRIWTESNTRYGYDSVSIQENTGQKRPAFRHISRRVLLKTFSHNLDLRKNTSSVSARKLFVRESMNCLTARKLKARQ